MSVLEFRLIREPNGSLPGGLDGRYVLQFRHQVSFNTATDWQLVPVVEWQTLTAKEKLQLSNDLINSTNKPSETGKT